MRTAYPDSAAALALVDKIFGPPDAAARRAVDILHAQGAALAWVRDTTGRYPSPRPVADAIQEAATALRRVDDERDPREVLSAVAAEALAAYLSQP
jgi:hypothetical protein